MSDIENVRTFIAIELPDIVRMELKQVQNQIKDSCLFDAKWVDPKGIHLTLKFLGSVSATRLDKIIDSVQKAAHGAPQFHLRITGVGAFPNLKRVQIIWAGIEGDLDILQNLQEKVERR